MSKAFYISTDHGCGIRAGTDIDDVKDRLCREIGEDNVREVREATAHDIAWVRSMGGYVPPAFRTVRPEMTP